MLPPLPVWHEWLVAGSTAGLLLGISELALLLVLGEWIQPELAALTLALELVVVALLSLGVGLVMHALGIRLSRSGLVGAVVGPVAAAGLIGDAWQLSAQAGAISVTGVLAGLFFAAGAGLTAYWLGEELEDAGIVASAPLVWGGAAVVLAVAERSNAREVTLGGVGVAIGVAALIAALWVGFVWWSRRRSVPPARSFGLLFGWSFVGAAVAAAAPAVVPWLFFDPDLPAMGEGPPNLLVLALPDGPQSDAGRRAMPMLELLAFDGLSYGALQSDPRLDVAPGTRAVLADFTGNAVVPELRAMGYAAAAVFANRSVPRELAAAELDARPGCRRRLGEDLSWLASSPLLTGPASPLLAQLGIDERDRTAAQVVSAAERWLLNWTVNRRTAPFFLFVDLRTVAPAPRADRTLEAIDSSLGDLFDHLRALDVSDRTLVMALREDGDTGRVARAILRTPDRWTKRPRALLADREVRGGDLAALLLAAARSDGRTPVSLPGNPEA